MTRYQLAKIVDWAGTVETRKRMQKVVYLLQVAGCPLEAEYTLHHYGPYSQEVARLTDEMVRAGLLVEKTSPNAVGQRYSYSLTESVRGGMAEFEATPAGREQADALEKSLSKHRRLLQADLKELEHAATIVFFRRQGHDWPAALEKMCRFKGLAENGGQPVERAKALASQIVA